MPIKAVYTPPVLRHNGVLAQLVERLNGIEEVSGSNPLCSIPNKLRGINDLDATEFLFN